MNGALLVLVTALAAQTVLDRVIARVDSSIVMLSDLRAAVALGIVDGQGPGGESGAIEALIERRVMLAEVARFPAPEPADETIDQLTASMRERVGATLPSLMQSTGLDDAAIRALARDTLRIQAYIRQRFGSTATSADAEVRLWLRDARARATVTLPR